MLSTESVVVLSSVSSNGCLRLVHPVVSPPYFRLVKYQRCVRHVFFCRLVVCIIACGCLSQVCIAPCVFSDDTIVMSCRSIRAPAAVLAEEQMTLDVKTGAKPKPSTSGAGEGEEYGRPKV